jgi:hypothetical protein
LFVVDEFQLLAISIHFASRIIGAHLHGKFSAVGMRTFAIAIAIAGGIIKM